MAKGMNPQSACEDAMHQIEARYSHAWGGIVAINKKGEWGAAKTSAVVYFPYSVRNADMVATQVNVIID